MGKVRNQMTTFPAPNAFFRQKKSVFLISLPKYPVHTFKITQQKNGSNLGWGTETFHTVSKATKDLQEDKMHMHFLPRCMCSYYQYCKNKWS